MLLMASNADGPRTRESSESQSDAAKLALFSRMAVHLRMLIEITVGMENIPRLSIEDLRQISQPSSLEAAEKLLQQRAAQLQRAAPCPAGTATRLADESCHPFLNVHVDANGKILYIGLAKEDGCTIAHRHLGHLRIMKVIFVLGKKDDARKRMTARMRMKEIWDTGISVGLRHFVFLAFKSSDQMRAHRELRARAFFFAISSSSSFDNSNPQLFPHFNSVAEVRRIFGDFLGCSSVQKMASRMGLIFSRTLPLPLAFSSSSSSPLLSGVVQILPDIKCDDGSISTDGTGLILEEHVPPLLVMSGEDLREKRERGERQRCSFPQPSSRSPPAALQVRGYIEGAIFKGTLLVVQKMPCYVRPGVQLMLRESMVKVWPATSKDASARQGTALETRNQEAARPHLFSLEVNHTTREASTARLNRTLVALLHYGGVPAAFFLELAKQQLEDVVDFVDSRMNARQVVERCIRMEFGDGSSSNGSSVDGQRLQLVQQMLLSGVPLSDPFLSQTLQKLRSDKIKDLLLSHLPLERSFYLMGLADPSGSLREEEVVVLLRDGPVCGPCLIYRPPSLLPGNIRRVTAVSGREVLDILPPSAAFCVIFSTRGSRSITDCMGGGDLDGDKYMVILNREVVHHFNPEAPPPTPPPSSPSLLPIPSDSAALHDSLFSLWYKGEFYMRSKVGMVGNLHLAWMDKEGPASPVCRQLAQMYEIALDAQKTGQEVPSLKGFFIGEYPHFMRATGTYHSTSINGQIFDLVKSSFEDAALKKTKASGQGGVDIFLDKEISAFGDEADIAHWRQQFAEYERKIQAIINSPIQGPARRSKIRRLEESFTEQVVGLWKPSIFERFPPSTVLKQASALYSAAYGVWREESKTEGEQRDAISRGKQAASFLFDEDENFEELFNVTDDEFIGRVDDKEDELEMEEELECCNRGKLALRFAWLVAGAFLCHLKVTRCSKSVDGAIATVPISCEWSFPSHGNKARCLDNRNKSVAFHGYTK